MKKTTIMKRLTIVIMLSSIFSISDSRELTSGSGNSGQPQNDLQSLEQNPEHPNGSVVVPIEGKVVVSNSTVNNLPYLLNSGECVKQVTNDNIEIITTKLDKDTHVLYKHSCEIHYSVQTNNGAVEARKIEVQRQVGRPRYCAPVLLSACYGGDLDSRRANAVAMSLWPPLLWIFPIALVADFIGTGIFHNVEVFMTDISSQVKAATRDECNNVVNSLKESICPDSHISMR